MSDILLWVVLGGLIFIGCSAAIGAFRMLGSGCLHPKDPSDG